MATAEETAAQVVSVRQPQGARALVRSSVFVGQVRGLVQRAQALFSRFKTGLRDKGQSGLICAFFVTSRFFWSYHNMVLNLEVLKWVHHCTLNYASSGPV